MTTGTYRRAALVATVVAVFATSGCAGATIRPGAWSDPLAVIREAADGLSDGSSFTGRVHIENAGEQFFSGDDAPDAHAYRVERATTPRAPGHTAVFIDDDLYIKRLGGDTGAPEGWGLLQGGAFAQGYVNGWAPPSQWVPAVAAEIEDVEPFGVRLYTGGLDLDAVAPELSGIGSGTLSAFGGGHGHVDVSVSLDAAGRLTWLSYEFDGGRFGTVRVTYRFDDHGAPGPIEPPDPDEVTTITEDDLGRWLED